MQSASPIGAAVADVAINHGKVPRGFGNKVVCCPCTG